MGLDGSIAYTVAIVRGYIFDATCPRAMYLTQENLGWSCMGTFIRIHGSYEFKEFISDLSFRSMTKLSILTKLFVVVPPALHYLLVDPGEVYVLEHRQDPFEDGECIVMSFASSLAFLKLGSLAGTLMKEREALLAKSDKAALKAINEFLQQQGSPLTPVKIPIGVYDVLDSTN